MEKISEHLSYAEATTTSTGVDNTPQEQHIVKMKAIAKKIFEPLRKGLGGKPIRVNSMFRSKGVNQAIGGAHKYINGKYVATSQHCSGEALDLDGLKSTNAELFFYILDNLDFDQLIWEKGDKNNADWIHVSYKSKEKNRKAVLVFTGSGYYVYEEGCVNRPKPKAKPKAKPKPKIAVVKKEVLAKTPKKQGRGRPKGSTSAKKKGAK